MGFASAPINFSGVGNLNLVQAIKNSWSWETAITEGVKGTALDIVSATRVADKGIKVVCKAMVKEQG